MPDPRAPAHLLLLLLLVLPPALLPLRAAAQAPGASPELAALRAEVAAMRAELDALRGGGATWMDKRRAEEARAIADDASAAAEALGLARGGYDGDRFFLAGGGYTLNIAGQLQFRYAALFNDAAEGEEADRSGFEFRRLRLKFFGTLANPFEGSDAEGFGYFLQLEHSRSTGNTFVLDALASYTWADDTKLQGGIFKLPFTRQTLMSSARTLAVERSLANEFFTLNRGEQIQLSRPFGDAVRTWIAFSDGANGNAFNDRGVVEIRESAEYAFTGRAEAKLLGEWKQNRDIVAWDAEPALFVAGAAHHQVADVSGQELTAYTADLIAKTGNVAVLAAGFFATGSDEGAGDDRDQYGWVAEVGYSLTETLQPFGRFDHIDDGEVDLSAVTAGLNVFFKDHAAKFTIDGLVVLNPENPTPIQGLRGAELSSGVGLLSSDLDADEDLYALRAQFQLLF